MVEPVFLKVERKIEFLREQFYIAYGAALSDVKASWRKCRCTRHVRRIFL